MKRLKFRARLRTILLWVNVIVLLMPLVAIGGLRLYETELMRRTEAEVVSQTALIKAMYEQMLREELGDDEGTLWARGSSDDGFLLEGDGDEVGRGAAAKWPVNVEDRFRPVPIDLDLRRAKVYAQAGSPQPPSGPVHPAVQRAGSRLEPVLIEAQKMTMSGMRVVDLQGNVVASSQEVERGHSVGHHEDVERALDGEFVKILRERNRPSDRVRLSGLARDTPVQVVTAIPVMIEERVVGAVVAWRTPIGLSKGIYENRVTFGVLLGSFLLAVLAISALTSVYIGRPIQRLMLQTGRVAGGGRAEVIKRPGTFEVQQLSESIATMAQALASRSEYINTFAKNVSHEFKTPLTTIRATVELFEDHWDTMSVEQRGEFLRMLDTDAQRLERLVGRLSELARADVLEPGGESCALFDVLEAIVGGASDVVFEDEGIEDRVRVAIGEEALRSVLGNLLLNARQHGATEVRVRVVTGEAGDFVEIWVHDNGPGISEGNRAKIFDEFFTTRRDTGGTGLGLSIVRSLLKRHGGEIAYVVGGEGDLFEGGSGAVFCVRLGLVGVGGLGAEV